LLCCIGFAYSVGIEELIGLTEFHLLDKTRRALCGVHVDLREGHAAATNSREVTCPHCLRLVFLEYSRPLSPAEPRIIHQLAG
jgi:hypothetical protein